jgi:Ligand-gated ion channel/Bacterial extracellular solute-binding proteins, family 3
LTNFDLIFTDWRCFTSKPEFLNAMYNSSCDLGVAGMAPFPDRIEKGLRFSVPSIRSGFAIMVTKVVQAPSMWYFFSAMSWGVWVLMIVTGIIVGVIVWLFEVGMRALNTDTHNMSNVMWDTLGRPVQMRDYRLASFPANLTAILWSFLVFILMVIYSANLTANLTINQFKNDIKGLQDLPGKAVASFEGHQDELKKYNIASMGMPWNGKADEVAMINTLKSGLVKALVFDSSLLEIYDATDCDTMLVGDTFDLHDQCVAFSANTWQNYPEFVDAFDIAMLTVVQGTGGIEELINRFITVPKASCKTNDLASGYSSVSIQQVAGLWVILALSIVFCAFIVIFYRLWEAKIGPWAAKKGWYNPKHSERLKVQFETLKRSGFSTEVNYSLYAKDDDEDDDRNLPVQVRYAGASKGYVDGSTDIFPHGVPAPKPEPKLKEGYITKRRKKFGSGRLVVPRSVSNIDPSQQNGGTEIGINGRKSSLASLSTIGEASSKRVAFASSTPSADGLITTGIDAGAVAAPLSSVVNGGGNGVGIAPNDSAILESPRTFGNRMATFKLSDVEYNGDGDDQV